MRQLIAGMRVTLDGRMEGPDGVADWVDAWSEDYGLTPGIDACLLGGGMYPGYERYWTGVRDAPDQPAWITGQPPTPGELAWSRFIAETPHYVLSKTLADASWPTTRFLRSLDEVAALKRQSGRAIYLVGGARTTASLIDAGLVDELRLIVHPLIAGAGKSLFAPEARRRGLAFREIRPLPGGRALLSCAIA